MPTPAEMIDIGRLSQFLAANDIAKKGLYGGGVDLNLPRKIYMIRKNLEWLYDLDSSDETLQATANYLYALCGRYALAAQNISGGSGVVSPINPIAPPSPYYFLVDATTFIATGETTVTMPSSWTGYNLQFARGAMVQTTVDSEPSYFSYNTSTREFIISPAAGEGELFALIPV